MGDLDVSHGPIEGTVVEADEVPLAIDELPLVALLGCFAEGETIVRGAEELRVKESDRIATVVEGLRGLGADIEAAPDGFRVQGTGGLRGGRIDSHGDHRLALLGAVAGLASREGVEVVGMEAAEVSYPSFAAGPREPQRNDRGGDRRPRRGRQIERGAGRGRAPGLHLPGQRRDVPQRRAGRAASAVPSRLPWPPGSRIELATGCGSTART